MTYMMHTAQASNGPESESEFVLAHLMPIIKLVISTSLHQVNHLVVAPGNSEKTEADK
jgi:hypothetical protein